MAACRAKHDEGPVDQRVVRIRSFRLLASEGGFLHDVSGTQYTMRQSQTTATLRHALRFTSRRPLMA